MGMKNQGTHTKVGTGELSEAVFAFALIGKTLNIDMWDVLSNYDNREAHFDTVSFKGDGKTDEAVRELRAYADGFKTDTTYNVINNTVRFVNGYTFPSFDTVTNTGGSPQDKDDITLYLDGVRVQGFSLKWDHMNVYRQQGPAFKSINNLYGKFVDMDGAESAWSEALTTFMSPARRNSGKRGDYGTELRANTDKMQNDYDRIIWGEFVARMSEADKHTIASALVRLIVGDKNDNMTVVDVSSGTTHDVSVDDVEGFASTMGRLAFRRNDSTGRTRRLILTNDDVDMVTFEFTQSANHAGGGLDRAWRTPKPQVYVKVAL